MSHGKLPCPECNTMNDAPAEGTKKITCSNCGVILVLNKVYGDNWPAQAKKHGGGDAAPAKPKIMSRRDKMKSGAKAEPAEEKPSRSTRGRSTRGRRGTTSRDAGDDAGDRRSRSEKRRSSNGMPPAMIFGSIGLFIVVGVVLAFMVNKQNEEKEAQERAKIEKDEAKKKEAAEKKAAQEAELAAMDKKDEEAANAAKEETTAAVKEEKPKPKKVTKKRGRKQDPLPLPEMSADVKGKLDKAVAELKNLDSRNLREAGDTCFEHRKEAIAMLVNEVMALDYTKEDDSRRAWPMLEVIRNCSEHSYKFDRNTVVMTWPPKGELEDWKIECEAVALYWWKWWKNNKDTWKPPVESEEDF